MKRIAIFSDIHGNLQALQSILKDIDNEKIDKTICLGDVIGIGPNPKETLQLIKKNNIELLLGNHEIYFLNQLKNNEILEAELNHIEHHKWISSQLENEDMKFLKKCSLYKIIKNGKKNIKLSHFLLKDNLKNEKYPFLEVDLRKKENINDSRIKSDADYNLFGHIHKKQFFEKDNKFYYCIGSSGCVKDNNTYYDIITVGDNKFSIDTKNVQFDRKKFNEIIKEKDYPEKNEIYNKFFC